MLDIGRNVRRLRRARDLTQKQFAGLVGMHPQHVSAVERGLRPTPPVIDRLARALGVDQSELLRSTVSADLPAGEFLPAEAGQ